MPVSKTVNTKQGLGSKMAKYECTVCGYTYDEAKGIPEAGIAPGTAWDELPDDWVCPLCGASKSDFQKQSSAERAVKEKTAEAFTQSVDMRELSPTELAALCSNLARGCEKQYKKSEAALYAELADYFQRAASPASDGDINRMIALIENDLKEGFPKANAVAAGEKDRGALRALAWSEKVSRILKSLLTRYIKEGDSMLENTGVYVCTVCGFVYIGDMLPQVCPVCKVPNRKFENIEGR